MIMWGKVALNTVKPFPSDLKMTWVQYLKISLFCKIRKRDFGCSFGEWKTERKDSLVFPYESNYFQFLPFHSSTAVTGNEKGKEEKKNLKKNFKGTCTRTVRILTLIADELPHQFPWKCHWMPVVLYKIRILQLYMTFHHRFSHHVTNVN